MRSPEARLTPGIRAALLGPRPRCADRHSRSESPMGLPATRHGRAPATGADSGVPCCGRSGEHLLSPTLAAPHPGLRSGRWNRSMPDLLVALLLVAAILLIADLLLAGGAMTMTGMSAMVGAVAHPLAAGALVVLVVVVVLLLGGAK